MSLPDTPPKLDFTRWNEIADETIVSEVRAGQLALYEVLVRRYNQRLFRASFAILRDHAEAEDVIQETYVRAYLHLGQFAGTAKFSTWLTRIAVHEALSRLQRQSRQADDSSVAGELPLVERARSKMKDPEQNAYRLELRQLLEDAIGELPVAYRSVFVLRAVEGLSSAEAAACLDIGEEAVKTRFHRARAMLRVTLRQHATHLTREAFPFHLSRCDRVVSAVMRMIEDAGGDFGTKLQ